jgi:hypothetical protein
MEGALGTATCLIVVLVAGIVIQLCSGTDSSAARWFYVSLISKIIFVFGFYFTLVWLGGDGFSLIDDRNYDKYGAEIAAAWRALTPYRGVAQGYTDLGYVYFTGFLYTLFGHSTLVPRLVNSLFAAAVVFPVYRIACRLWNVQAGRIAAVVAAVLPNLTYWGGQQFKDVIIMALSAFAVERATALHAREVSSPNLTAVLVVLLAMVICGLRAAFGAPFAAAVVCYLSLGHLGRGNYGRLFLLSMVAVAAVFFFLSAGGMEKIAVKAANFEAIAATGSAADASQGVIRRFQVRSVSELYKLPGAFIATMVIPFPPNPAALSLEEFRHSLYIVCNFFWVCLIPYAVVGILSLLQTRPFDALLLCCVPLSYLAVISVVALGVLRYREQFIPFYCIWAALGIQQGGRWRMRIMAMYLAIFSVSVSFYILLKAV